MDFLSYPFIIAYPFIREVRVGWLLVLGLREGLIECATVYIKSWVIAKFIPTSTVIREMRVSLVSLGKLGYYHNILFIHSFSTFKVQTTVKWPNTFVVLPS